MKALIRNRRRRGFTLIELMIVVAIIGILAVLAIYGVSRYLKSAKTAEATNNIGAMAKNAGEALQRENMSGTYVLPGTSTPLSHALCMSALATVPIGKAAIAGSKYTSDPAEWKLGTAAQGWNCLKFSVDQPQYYMYNYTSDSSASTTGTTASCIAQGDLDGNGITSDFTILGKIPAGQDTIVWAPKALETNPEE